MGVMDTALSTIVAHGDQFGRGGDGGFFFLFPLVWIAVIGVIAFVVFRRRRRWLAAGGPRQHQTAGAIAILAERFAKGEMTANEYAGARRTLETDISSEPDQES